MKKLELRDWVELIRKCRALEQAFERVIASVGDSIQHDGVVESLYQARKQLAAEIMDIGPKHCNCAGRDEKGKEHCNRLIAEGHPEDVRVHRLCGDTMAWAADPTPEKLPLVICTVCGEADLDLVVQQHNDERDEPTVCAGSHTSNFKVPKL